MRPFTSANIYIRAMVFSLVLGFLLIATPTPVHAQQTISDIDALIAEPQPRIHIPGLDFTNAPVSVTQDASGRTTYIEIPYIGIFIQSFYQLAIALIGLAAVIMIVIAGVQWITSAGSPDRISAAKNRMVGAITGLILAVSAYTILYTVNPELVRLKALKVQYVTEQSVYTPEDDNMTTDDLAKAKVGAKPTWDRNSFDCDNKEQYLGKDYGVLPINETELFSCPDKGVVNAFRIHKDLGEKVCDVGEALKAIGYQLDIQDSYRGFDEQVELWCGIGAKNYSDVNQRAKYYAVPGYSKHGIGVAIDVVLADKNGNRVYTEKKIDSKSQCTVSSETLVLLDLLANTFYKTDSEWNRLNGEVWHFEYGTGGNGRVGHNVGLPSKCTGP